MRGVDIWQREREAAQLLPNGLRIQRIDVPTVIGRVWNPKAVKPTAHYRFRDIAARESFLDKFVRNFEAQQAEVAARLEQRRGTQAQRAAVQVGAIFVNSWGYDQTNVDYYEVTEIRGQDVVVRRIARESVPGSEGMMCCQVRPRPGEYLERYAPERKRLQFSGDGPCLAMDHGFCGLWQGESNYCSWYA